MFGFYEVNEISSKKSDTFISTIDITKRIKVVKVEKEEKNEEQVDISKRIKIAK